MTETLKESLKDETQLVTFLLREEEFGFDIMNVQEIIRLPKMARIPRAPNYIDGVANLRGVILPVIDVRTRFNMERAEETDRTRVLVIDIDGVKTGLRVDRVSHVTRVNRADMELPGKTIRGTTTDYLDSVVKLDDGKRIIMALNAAKLCDVSRDAIEQQSHSVDAQSKTADADTPASLATNGEVLQMVGFRLAREEFAFPMERVREILRVVRPKQIPDAPEHVLGVVTLRGQILPIIDLRQLLGQRSFASEQTGHCAAVREEYTRWVESCKNDTTSASHSKPIENVKTWIGSWSSSNQILMESLGRIRTQNERVVKAFQNRTQEPQAFISEATAVPSLMLEFESLVNTHIQEDQRVIVVEAHGSLLGLVVDHVNEVLNVDKAAVENAPALATSNTAAAALSGIAKLNDGQRLVMLLNADGLLNPSEINTLSNAADELGGEEVAVGETSQNRKEALVSEVQLVTFLLGTEEYGLPISQIQEIDRLSRITRIPKTPPFMEGITNLRGEVITVLNTRRLFALEERASDDRSRIIIVDRDGVKTGIIVDSVRQVLSLSKTDIAPPPAAVRGRSDADFISGIGKVDDGRRMILLLDVERILTAEQQDALAEVGA